MVDDNKDKCQSDGRLIPIQIAPLQEWATPLKSLEPEQRVSRLEYYERELLHQTDARSVEINPSSGVFTFTFEHGVAGGPPSAILDGIDEQFEGDETMLRVRRAVGLIWRQFILREFERAIGQGRVSVFGRVRLAAAEFSRIPADVWPALEVDWAKGHAIAPDGTVIYSLRASQAGDESPRKRVGRKSDKETVLKAAEQKFPNGRPQGLFWPDIARELNYIIAEKIGRQISEPTIKRHMLSHWGGSE